MPFCARNSRRLVRERHFGQETRAVKAARARGRGLLGERQCASVPESAVRAITARHEHDEPECDGSRRAS